VHVLSSHRVAADPALPIGVLIVTFRRPSNVIAPVSARSREEPLLAGITLFMVFWFLNPFAPLLADLDVATNVTAAAAAEDTGADFLRLSWIPIHCMIVVLAATRAKQLKEALQQHWLLVWILVLALASTAWSVEPEISLRRGIALVISSLFGLYLGVNYSPIELLRLLGRALALAIVGSFIFALLRPDVAMTSELHEGEWRGLFVNKNSLGQMMLISCLVRSVLILACRRRRWHIFWLALSLGLLLLSGAKTPLVLGAGLLVVAGLVRKFQVDRHRFSFVASMVGVLSLLAVLIGAAGFDEIMTLLGKDPTLTGRTEIWSLVWNAVQPRLWVGYGYGAFWSNPEGPAAEIWDVLDWRVPNAHSGILELWLGLGILGLMLFLGLAVSTFRSIMQRAAILDRATAIWLICYAVMFLGYIVGESATLEQNAANWVVFCSVIAVSRRRVLLRYRAPDDVPATARGRFRSRASLSPESVR
jgi:exopolysaccharide production protein ExoQ